MKSKRGFFNATLCVLASAVYCLNSNVAVAKDCNIGQTIFTDSMYGIGTGAVVGGLFMLTKMSDTNAKTVIQDIATASLIGGGIGAIIGVVEIGLCTQNNSLVKKQGLEPIKPVVMGINSTHIPGMGINIAYNL